MSYLVRIRKIGLIRSSRPEVFCKKVFLEISKNSQENTCASVSFLINLQVLSCEFFQISKNTFSYRTHFFFRDFLPKYNRLDSRFSFWLIRWKCKIIPAGIYVIKVNDRNARTRSEICSKLTTKTPERRYKYTRKTPLKSFWCLYC